MIRFRALLALLLMVVGCSSEGGSQGGKMDEDDYIQEKPKDGWSASAVLHTTEGDAFSMQANFDKSGYYTLQFGIQYPPIVNPGLGQPPVEAIADIVWSVEGNAVRRRVSIGNGTSVSGPGQAVGVTITDTTPASAFPVSPYVASVQVSPGTRPSTTQPPTLKGIAQTPLGPGGFMSIPIPLNAGVISVEITAIDTAGGESTKISVVHSNGVSFFKTYFVGSAQGSTGFISVFPGTTSIGLNNTGLTTVDVGVVWGIDG